MTWMTVSWTKLNTFEMCPWKFWLMYGSKFVHGEAIIPFTDSPATKRGSHIHSLLERAATEWRQTGTIPQDVVFDNEWKPWWETMIQKLVNANDTFATEKKLCFSRGYEHSFADKYYKPMKNNFGDVFFNGSIDFLSYSRLDSKGNQMTSTVANCIDYKTGQVKPSGDQLKLYALMVFSMLPSVQRVNAKFIFLDHKKAKEEVFSRDQLPEIKTRFEKSFFLINSMLREITDNEASEKIFKCATTQENCRWCAATKEECEKR